MGAVLLYCLLRLPAGPGTEMKVHLSPVTVMASSLKALVLPVSVLGRAIQGMSYGRSGMGH